MLVAFFFFLVDGEGGELSIKIGEGEVGGQAG